MTKGKKKDAAAIPTERARLGRKEYEEELKKLAGGFPMPFSLPSFP
jgi:hypothetical protein